MHRLRIPDDATIARAASRYRAAFKDRYDTGFRHPMEAILRVELVDFLSDCNRRPFTDLIAAATTTIPVWAASDGDPYGKVLPTSARRLHLTASGWVGELVHPDYDAEMLARFDMVTDGALGLTGLRLPAYRALSLAEAVDFILVDGAAFIPAVNVSGFVDALAERFAMNITTIVEHCPAPQPA